MRTETLSALGINLPETNICLLMSDAATYGCTETQTIQGIGLLKQIIKEYNEDLESFGEEVMDSAKKVVKRFGQKLRLLDHEELHCIFLDSALHAIKEELITSGSDSATIIDTKAVAKKAILANANSVILVHNHPSGNTMPSNADLTETEKLTKALKTLEIKLIDHIIVGKNKYYSFADEKNTKF